MRAFTARSVTAPAMTRGIAGAAPVLYFPATSPKVAPEQQIAENTQKALGMIKAFKGPVPAPYTRRTTTSFEEVEKDIEQVLGGAAKMRKAADNDAPMDKLTLIERVLKHAYWSYQKDQGNFNWEEIEKWVVYTPGDVQKFAALKREVELKAKYQAFVQARKAAGGPNVTLPAMNLDKEYAAAIDREVLVEKRTRYDALAVNTTERDEAAVSALLNEYSKPAQDKRLDNLVDLLEKFKPVLAREAITQRLTVKHLQGQLSFARWMDWNPEVRDRCELEVENLNNEYIEINEEARVSRIRLRTVNEVKGVMEKAQIAEQVAAGPSAGAQIAKKGGKDTSARDKLLREIIALQSRKVEAKAE